MKAKPSNLKPEVRKEQGQALSVAIESWEEESFTVPVCAATVLAANPDLEWEGIEAVGAADDASRFRIDDPFASTVGACN